MPVHDAPVVTKRCLDSLALYCGGSEIILVDDGSKEQSTRDLLQEQSRTNGWRLITNDVALGHSRACEVGAQVATRPYLCLLNSDTYVTPWGWSAIVEVFAGDRRVAVVGPSTSWATTEQRLIPAMHCRHFWTDSQIVAFAKRHLERRSGPDTMDLDEINGFAFFIRRDIWTQIGGFDKALTDYGNESELCVRLRRGGHRLVWARSAYIHHFGGQSYAQLGEGYTEMRKQEVRRFLSERGDPPPGDGADD